MLPTCQRRSILLAVLMLSSLLIVIENEAVSTTVEAASGVDVHPISFDVTYVSSADESRYGLLSSHDPSGNGFNRPVNLYVIDAMVNISSRISITVRNSGSTSSGGFPMKVVVTHNEYSDFEIFNQTVNVGSISPSSTTTASVTISPRYGGNHTLTATTLFANDDNQGNDGLSKSFAVGQVYDNCDNQGGWTLSTGWQVDSGVSLSNSAFNVGSGGTSSTYGANWDRSLTSPTYDFSNAHPSPNNYGKLGFFYTGSAGSGDGIRIEWWDSASSNWVNTVNNGFSIEGVIDGDLTDGTSWLIQNEANQPGGSQRPGYNIPTSVLDSTTKFRFRFISDASDHGAGYWIEDIVMVYDEKAWVEEFGVSMTKGVDGHSRRGHWAEHVVTIQNEGNITDFYLPTVSGLPADWDYQFVHMSGSTILPTMTLELGPGESMNFKVQIKPGASATVGSHSATASILSTLESSVGASVTLSTLVDPDYIPAWEPIPLTHYCLPGNSCEFSINLSNIGDGSDTFAVSATQIVQWSNWTFDVSFNQPPTVTIPPGSSANVLLQADIPNTALPGQTASIDVIATSQADNGVTATARVNLTASMITNAGVGIDSSDIPQSGWWVEPGDSLTVPFTVWNNASSQDSFTFALDNTNMRGWNATVVSNPSIVIRAGENAKVQVEVTAPLTAQAGDPAPILTPVVTSSLSGTLALANPYGGIRVTMLHDLVLRNLSSPSILRPGFAEAIAFEVENRGNGPDHAIVDVSGVPPTWDYHIEVGGNEQFGPITLSPSYEGNHIVQFFVILTPPGGEEANLELDLSVSISPENGQDLMIDDNTYEFSVRTERVTRPLLTMDSEQLFARTDSLQLVQLVLMNDGNAVDGAMRIKISADTILPGITSTLSNGGQEINLNQWLDTPLPPQQELHLQWLIGVASDIPVGTQVTFSIVVEASPDNDGLSQDINQTLVLTVDSHRELEFTHSLMEEVEVNPGQRMLFKVNATSYSSFTEQLVLEVVGGDEWSVSCNNQDEANHQWTMVAPSTNDPSGRDVVWDCEFVVPEGDLSQSLSYSIIVDNETYWTGIALISMAAQEDEESGGFLFSLGDSEQQLPIIIGVSALVFLIFVGVMVIAINRKRNKIDDEYDDEEDEGYTPATTQAQPQVVAAQPTHQAPHAQFAQVQQQQPVPAVAHQQPVVVQQQPTVSTPPPEQSGFSDDQYRAAGWTEERIAELRREEQLEMEEWMAQQAAISQQHAYANMVQGGVTHQQISSQQHAGQPIASQSQSATAPASSGLDNAFGSLGVSEHQPAQTEVETAGSDSEPASSAQPLDKAAAFAALGSPASSEEENDGESQEAEETMETPSASEVNVAEAPVPAVEGVESEDHTNQPNEDASTSIPIVACSYCERNLKHEDRWVECSECGIYSHAECREGQKACARCGATF